MEPIKGQEAAQYMSDFVNCMGEHEFDPFAEQMAIREHPTLQQAFMRLMWKVMRQYAKKENFDARNEATVKLCRELTKEYEDYPPLPFI